MAAMRARVLIRGGGDLASGVALRLHRAGIIPLITELAQPRMVRRTVSFGEAVYTGAVEVEGVRAHRAEDWGRAQAILNAGEIAVLVDPELAALDEIQPLVLVDARMSKRAPYSGAGGAEMVIGLGPGFVAGENCDAVVETMRGHHLGRVFWQGAAAEDTGVPGSIAKHGLDRVLRAPADGELSAHAQIGEQLQQGDLIAQVDGQSLTAPFDGVLRGLIHPSVPLIKGMKIGDLDPRNDPRFVQQVSDKALAIGGGVLEALLTKPEIRGRLWR